MSFTLQLSRPWISRICQTTVKGWTVRPTSKSLKAILFKTRFAAVSNSSFLLKTISTKRLRTVADIEKQEFKPTIKISEARGDVAVPLNDRWKVTHK